MNFKLNILLAGLLAIGSAGAFAQAADHSQHGAAASGAAASSSMAMTNGEVRKVDLEQGKVTLKHEAITNLDMPPMTMIFRVSDPEMLKSLKSGDKVSFHAESKDGGLVVTHIQAAQ